MCTSAHMECLACMFYYVYLCLIMLCYANFTVSLTSPYPHPRPPFASTRHTKVSHLCVGDFHAAWHIWDPCLGFVIAGLVPPLRLLLSLCVSGPRRHDGPPNFPRGGVPCTCGQGDCIGPSAHACIPLCPLTTHSPSDTTACISATIYGGVSALANAVPLCEGGIVGDLATTRFVST